jgi:tetratricopeptide (TPR) repeat protein
MITLKEIARTPALLAAKLRKLERQGRFDEALRDCLQVRDGHAYIPALDGADKSERAEIMLRYGALMGYLGQNSQIAKSQEQSKDLLTKALAEFIDLGDEEKAAECENYIALSYFRHGEMNEAGLWLESSFARPIPKLSEPRIAWYGIVSLIHVERHRFLEAIELLRPVENDFIEFGDSYFLGIYYGNIGIALKDLKQFNEALASLERSRFYYQRCGHRIYLGATENNLALLYRDLSEFPKAHSVIDSAVRTFRKAKDKTRTGYALDTKANIYLSQCDLENALSTIDRAIDILKRGENAAYSVESLLTRAKILLNLDRFADGTMSLLEAVDIQRVKVDEGAARQLIDEFEVEWKRLHASKGLSKAVVSTGSEEMQLLLPQSLSGHGSYSAVRISNAHLGRYGLLPGMLAVVVDEEVSRGDLVAIEDLTDNSVKCGLFDSDFGLVCLERGDAEPELFDEGSVRVLGKIVGVADNTRQTANGEVVVHALSK